MAHVLSPEATVYTIAGLAAVQVMVHLVCFLHLSTASSQRWNVTAMAFAVVVVVILIVGSLWIMHNMSEQHDGRATTSCRRCNCSPEAAPVPGRQPKRLTIWARAGGLSLF